MNNFGFTGTRAGIEVSEVSSVRDMILGRAHEKSSSMAQEREEKLSDSVKNDVMSSARKSIASSGMKTFGNLTGTERPSETEPVIENNQIEALPLKHNVQSVDNTRYTDSMRDETMTALKNQYGRRINLTETLKFLNTQAAIKMVNSTHSKIV